jgi:hypothetical protein
MVQCPVCRDLLPSDDQFEEAAMMRKTLSFHIVASLDELHETAQKGCILCSILHQAGSQFADRFWGKYNPKCARLDFLSELLWLPPATVHVTLEASEKGSEGGQTAWNLFRVTGTKQFVPVSFEIYRKEGMYCHFDFESDF